MALMEIDHLSLTLGGRTLIDDVSLRLARGEILGLVGESGSGKSLTALSILGLAPPGATLTGAIRVAGVDVLGADAALLDAIRGRDIGMVFQEPMTALNPVLTIGDQVAESARLHRRLTRRAALALARETLGRVGLPAEDFPLGRYPHELSGGQRQRVAIAIAVALGPGLILADEPTTALDVTTQTQILDLLVRLAREDGAGLLLISHDLALIATLVHQVAVMKEGRIVDGGETGAFFRALSHPYSRALADATTLAPRAPRGLTRVMNPAEPPLLSATGIVRDYAAPASLFGRKAARRAVDQVSLTIAAGESVGLVGESGSGKSTLARTLLGLDTPDAGEVRIGGEVFSAARPAAQRRLRRRIQGVFQDPYSSFDPRWRVERLVAEPLALLEAPPGPRERRRRVEAMLDQVGLPSTAADRLAHEFSGGQRQRIALARALIIEPDLVVLDEATSALDVTIRAQILALMADLSTRLNLAWLFVTHDLAVVRAVTDRLLVMRAGKIVEEGETIAVFAAPRHPYTVELLAATPSLEHTLASRFPRAAHAG
jgi:peptide/nickel transport system ATP-binding protein